MTFINIFTNLVILFVVANLLMTIYNFLNRKRKEGLENVGECGVESYCQTDQNPSVCSGSNKPCGGTAPSPTLSPAPVTLSGEATTLLNTVADFEPAVASMFDGPAVPTVPTVPTVPVAAPAPEPSPSKNNKINMCNVVEMHNTNPASYTHSNWFPTKLDNMNLSQAEYEESGRRFLNEESVKKGVATVRILDSEAEILGRLLWRVHVASIQQKCAENSQVATTKTMNHELALMQKVHSIQSGTSPSSLVQNSSQIDNTCSPRLPSCPSTTGIMTALSGDNASPPTGKAGPASVNNDGVYSGYTSDYKPTNPNKKPRPYNSIYDIF